MFTACNTSTLKNSILFSFSSPLSRLRVVVATVAFGMGVHMCKEFIIVVLHLTVKHTYKRLEEQVEMVILHLQLCFSQRETSYPFMESGIVAYCQNKAFVGERYFLMISIYQRQYHQLAASAVIFVQ